MMRSAALRARQFADTTGQLPDPRELWLNGVPETSSKKFLRHVDKYGAPYWVPHKQRALANPDPAAQRDFFEVSDLLLDLDAEGASSVRPYADEDELRMSAKWAVTPERAAVRARVEQFKEQIHASRLGALKSLLRPASARLISPHDIFSAALSGAPAPSGPETHAAHDESANLPPRTRGDLDTVCLDNGIPPHALQDDEQLLRWMMLRRDVLQVSRREHESEPPTRAQLSNALRHQTSLSGIRRVVFQSIAAGTFIGSFAKQRTIRSAMTSRIRRACDGVLNQTLTRRSTALETLAFIGNLSARITQPERSVGTPLCGLALHLSAEVGDIEAMSQWLQRGYRHKAWGERKMAADVQLALASFPPLLSDDCGTGQLQQARDRQHLFRVLTGVDAEGQVAPESLRDVVMHYLSGACEAMPRTRLAMYESYVMLLAQLGAARLLWTEWRVSAPHARKLYDSKGGIVETVAAIFQKALCQLAHSAAASDHSTPRHLTLEECARLDHGAVAAQEAGSWRSVSTLETGVDEAVPLFELPLDGWTEAVKKLRLRTVSSSGART
ncbi:hypothetical protein HRG_005468 [Hirsutella rhossiliensis]|uniref:Uncharacterized protein n=1 Tax=Hirsutella rhossiliensis TaxID=111463 RepID=A0A9P8SHC4_9HYPO|nr:uncharacterized protein HRG_05468 [Hirsutella rhossiliensis]KAH0962958.1 hypothetical protein HRG_05468 [Hirsutella rhossiliensis]